MTLLKPILSKFCYCCCYLSLSFFLVASTSLVNAHSASGPQRNELLQGKRQILCHLLHYELSFSKKKGRISPKLYLVVSYRPNRIVEHKVCLFFKAMSLAFSVYLVRHVPEILGKNENSHSWWQIKSFICEGRKKRGCVCGGDSWFFTYRILVIQQPWYVKYQGQMLHSENTRSEDWSIKIRIYIKFRGNTCKLNIKEDIMKTQDKI